MTTDQGVARWRTACQTRWRRLAPMAEECHSAGRVPNRAAKRSRNVRRERDFQKQDRGPAAPPRKGGGDGFEVDFGFA